MRNATHLAARVRRTVVLIIAVEVIGLALLLWKAVAIYKCETDALSFPDRVQSDQALLACAGETVPDLAERERRAFKLLDKHENELKM
jgi:hypothetical protein